MKFLDHFNQIKEFLKPFEPIWNLEILENYPENTKYYPNESISLLIGLPKEDLIKISGRKIPKSIEKTPLSELILKINDLVQIGKFNSSKDSKVDASGWLKIRGKKRHEISILEKTIPDIMEKYNLDQLLDIGGGLGIFSQIISSYYNINVFCLDRDIDLIERGKKRFLSNQNLHFIHHEFGKEDKKISKYFEGNTLSLGLHTCGGLSKKHFDTKTKAILNFGCCYYKMNQNEFNISLTPNPLLISNDGLTLATRSHSEMSEKDYDYKIRVKEYRYTLHLLLSDKFGISEVIKLGSSLPKIYAMDFASYAIEQLNRNEITSKFAKCLTNSDLNNFYSKEKVQERVKTMIAQGAFRCIFGRTLELYILLDRAIYLEEKGLNVNMMEYFDESISPRNIGIFATL